MDPWVGRVLQHGLEIQFATKPPLTSLPVWTQIPKSEEKALALRKEVQALLNKRAIVPVSNKHSGGFYSTLFLVPKPGNRWRPVIDLSHLNKHILAPRFKMETAASVRASVNIGEFAVSIDLTDAYFHIPMAPRSQKFLRFAVDGQVFQFVCLPFGLNIAPWAFTRIMNAVMAAFRMKAESPSSNYLDDLMLRNASKQLLALDRDRLLTHLDKLGWLINRSKSDLEPAQDFCHLGMRFNTVENRVGLTDKRIGKILDTITSFLDADQKSARQWLQLLGLLNAAADLVRLGRLALRPLQMSLLAFWRPASGRLEDQVPIASFARPHLTRWANRTWLEEGVPLKAPAPTISICTDASASGWGANLLPTFDTVSGSWPPHLLVKHINELELRAVGLALQHWRPRLAGQSVMILSDNSTVVSYIRKQGGTFAPHLCLLVWDLLRWCDSEAIRLSVRHIPGKLNVVADSLSRAGQIVHTEWSLCPSVFSQICLVFDRPQVDMFATRWNAKLPTFVSPFPDPSAFGIDALSLDWSGMFLYAFPPTVLVPKVIQKVRDSDCRAILVAPLRWEKSWTTDLLVLTEQIPRKLPSKAKLLKQPKQNLFHPCPDRLALHAWKLSSKPSPDASSRVRRWIESQPLEGPPL